MLSEFQRKKIDFIFDKIDLDQDGLITKQDYQALVEKSVEALGKAAQPDNREWIQNAYMEFWAGFSQSADRDGDQGVNREEYLTFWAMAMENREFFDQICGGIITQLTRMFDLDGDNQLSPAEWAMLCQAYDYDPEEIETVFDKLDIKRDGYLDFQEMLEMSVQFYYSNNPVDPGNWMWGTLNFTA